MTVTVRSLWQIEQSAEVRQEQGGRVEIRFPVELTPTGVLRLLATSMALFPETARLTGAFGDNGEIVLVFQRRLAGSLNGL